MKVLDRLKTFIYYKVRGISLTLCTDEGALWWDADHKYGPKLGKYGTGKGKPGFGIMFVLKLGLCYQPIPKFWKIGFWKGEPKYNPWTGGNYLCIIKFPMIGPYISIAIGRVGIYLGVKTFELSDTHTSWVPSELIEKGYEALAITGSIRRTRTD